jgi:Tol biopolymer transport system component
MKKSFRNILRNVVGLAALVLVMAGCLPSETEPGSGLIVYVGTDHNIYTIDPNGENLLAVTGDALSNAEGGGESLVYQQPTWSPDSNRVAFIQTGSRGIRTQMATLFTALPDGSDLVETYSSESQFPFYLYWSPDSQRLSFLTTGGSEPGLVLYVVPPQGGEAQKLDIGQPFYWDWSPDSHAILIHTGGPTRLNPDARLALLDLDDDIVETELDLQPTFFQAPAWSPDGEKWLLAAESNSEGEGLLLTDTKGEVLSVLRSVDDSIAFSWSPDGEWVAYISEDNSGTQDITRKLVYLDPERVDESQSAEHDLVIAYFWSPDSHKIAYFVPSLSIPSGQRASLRLQESQFSLELNVIDVQTGISKRLIEFTPTDDFLNIMPYFDQYQRSATIWSPDSTDLVISALDLDGEPGIYVIETTEVSETRRLASGRLAFWSWK